MTNEEVPINLWNCYKTNAVEGWHNIINNMLGKPHPKIRDVIECVKKEADNSACLYLEQLVKTKTL